MSAREVIAGVEEYHAVSGPERIGDLLSERILSALAAAGYRLLGPDELDPVTVERFRQEVARLLPHYDTFTATDAARRQMLEHFDKFALRSLTGGQNG